MVSSAVRRTLSVLALVLAGMLGLAQSRAADGFVLGDIDGDGRRDAVLVVERARDGPLPAVYLAVFTEDGRGWRVLATIRLDDGAVVDRVRIVTGRLTANYRRHYPVDPPGRPTNRTIRSWAYSDGAFHGGSRAPPGEGWRRAARARLPR